MDYTVVRNFPRGFREKRSRGIVSFAVQGNKKIRVREERKNRRIYMRRVIERKGQKINGGRPIVCVPVMAEREEEILRQAKDFIGRGARMLEWRLDFFEGLGDPGRIRRVLKDLKPLCENTLLLTTVRTRHQGGNAAVTEQELMDTYMLLAESGAVDLIDVEFFELSQPAKVIRQIQQQDVLAVTSHHDFGETPDYGVMTALLEQMERGGADLVKLAVMPREASDVLELLRATSDFYEEHEETPVISMSMGHLGLVSRAVGEIFGSCVTFAAMEGASAPGQPVAEDLEKVLDFFGKERQR